MALRKAVLDHFGRSSRKKVEVTELKAIARAALPHETGLGAEECLISLLNELVDDEVLAPFSTTKLEQKRLEYVKLRETERERRRNQNRAMCEHLRETTVWVPKMVDVSVTTVTLDQMEKATKINAWLKAHPKGTDEVPHRERALEIFGDEKKLDGVARTALFGGRITLDDLCCRHCPEPLHYEACSGEKEITAGKPLLVVENSNTYWSCCQANRRVKWYAAVVYGKGKMINNLATGCDALWDLEEKLGAQGVFYFGDLDPEGLDIARGLEQKRAKQGLSPVTAEARLYRALIEKGVVNDCPSGQGKHHDSAWAKEWLGDELAKAYLLKAPKKRWPQEGLGAREIETALLSLENSAYGVGSKAE